MTSVNEIKEKYCKDEYTIKFMGHSIPNRIFIMLERFRSHNTDWRQAGFFSTPEDKKRFVNETYPWIRYIERNLKTADSKEQIWIKKKLENLKKERDELASKMLVIRNSITNKDIKRGTFLKFK